MLNVESYAAGQWIAPDSSARPIENAVTGAIMAQAGTSALPVASMLDYARRRGGPALRALTFHDRAKMLKALAQHLGEHKQALYDLSFSTGATQRDHLIDIDGGIGTLFVYASKGRRELPDAQVYLDGEVEQLSRNGTFVGQHICTPLHGAAIHINAYNFPRLGHAGEARPGDPRGRSCDRKACDIDQLRD